MTFFQKSLVERVILYQSDLKPTGPVYTPIKEMKLLAVSRRVISFEE
jgi:2'-5' RNA ligase